MQVDITSRQMDITPAIREYIESRVAKLEKWKTQLIRPHFILHKVPQGFSVDAKIGTPFGELVASAEARDMYEAVNLLEEKLARQLNKIQHKSESFRKEERLKDSFEGKNPY